VSYDDPACTWVEGDADAPKMKDRTSGGDDAMEPMDNMDDMNDMNSEPPMDDEPAVEPDGDALGGEADSAFDADASGGDAPKAKVKAKGGFKLGSD
jgi:hypothetical protein